MASLPGLRLKDPMSTIVTTLTSLPFTQFKRNRYFYVWYDLFFIVTCGALLAALVGSGYQGLATEWDVRWLLLLPIVCHLQILCSVYVHNATHNNFPRSVNRIVGELCGFVVLTRFASWEILHQRHHKYSDDDDNDPHPITEEARGYFPYLWATIVGVEAQLQRMVFEMFGDTPENRQFERMRAVVSFSVSFILLPLTWYYLLGPVLFFTLFIPAAAVGFFHLVHFNWSTHNPYSPDADFRPINLNDGFYRVGNLIWHGIYMHGNHHKNAGMFNPGTMAEDRALPIIRHGDSTDHYPKKKAKKAALVG